MRGAQVRAARLAAAPAIAVAVVLAAVAQMDARSDGAPRTGGVARTLTKSVAYYFGKDLTTDGSVLLGGFGHEPSSHWLEIVPRRRFSEGATTTVGVTDRAEIPGVL